jgi:light-regulated signal transduction histidine kinase (bacteriophytochrome)
VVSGISVVIRGRTRPYGVLSMFHTRKRRFESEEASTLASAANVIGMAIERAETEEQLRSIREELLRLNNDLEHRVAARTTELEAAYREAEALSYSIAHDLRAPLRAISGYAKILEEELAPILPPQAQNYLDRMSSNAVRLGTLIDALLALQRLSRQPLARSRIPLSEAVEDALAWLRSEQPGRDIEIVVDELGVAEVDPALMRLAFANLLSNALKFTRGRSPARVTVGKIDRDGERIYFVEDNGAGFDMRFADKLFGVFQRLHPESEYEGSGIGLASVYRIVTRHGGRIWAAAEVDRGATFFFTLGAVE